MTTPKHPARFTDAIIEAIAGGIDSALGVTRSEALEDRVEFRLLDPFAGVGGIFKLLDYFPSAKIDAVEIEPEWAAADPRITVGDALDLPWDDETFHVVCTSPTYGNRMADHHDAADDSRRVTYKHYLGRPLSENNSGQLQWGGKYREFHERAWAEAIRVLKPNGVVIVNVKDHIRKGQVMGVGAFHLGILLELGLVFHDLVYVPASGMRYGQNHGKRVEHEIVMTLGKWET